MSTESTKSIIHFSFGYHTSETVPLMDQIETDLRSFFGSNPEARRVFFEEALGGTEGRVNSFRKIKKPGMTFLETDLQEVLLREVRLKPEYYDPALLRTNYIANPNNAFRVATYGMLDRVEQDFEFEYNSEATNPQEAKLFSSRLNEAYAKTEEAINSAIKGESLDQVLKIYAYHHRLTAIVQGERNNRICERLVGELIKDQNKGRSSLIFVRLGESHDTIVDKFATKVHGKKRLEMPTVEAVYDYGRPCLTFGEQLSQRLERNIKYPLTREDLIASFVSSIVEFHLRVMRKDERPLRAALDQLVLERVDHDSLLRLITSLSDPNMVNIIDSFITATTS